MNKCIFANILKNKNNGQKWIFNWQIANTSAIYNFIDQIHVP